MVSEVLSFSQGRDHQKHAGTHSCLKAGRNVFHIRSCWAYRLALLTNHTDCKDCNWKNGCGPACFSGGNKAFPLAMATLGACTAGVYCLRSEGKKLLCPKVC
jgi:hypothetical protein